MTVLNSPDELRSALEQHTHLNATDADTEDIYECLHSSAKTLIVLPHWKAEELSVMGGSILIGRIEDETDKAVQFRSLNTLQNRHEKRADALHEWVPKSLIEYTAVARDEAREVEQ